MKLNTKILAALKQTVASENASSLVSEPVEVQEPIQQPQPELKPIAQPEPATEPEFNSQPKNPTDYKHISLNGLFNLLKIESEFKDENIDAFLKALNKAINNWLLKFHLGSILIELVEFGKDQLKLQFVFKGKEYPFVLSLNPNKVDSHFDIYDTAKKEKTFKDLSDDKDITQIVDTDKNYLANAYFKVLDLIK